MAGPYPILTVQPDDIIGDEALGSKTKFWFRRGDDRWLFKEAREGTGEDWAEKIGAEIAHRLDVPAATVELADFQGRRGCASRSFVNTEQGEALIHGNDILAGTVVGYDRNKRFGQADHTLKNIYRAIRKLLVMREGYALTLTQFASYLVLDALIGNTDRHHENWGLVVRTKPGALEGLDVRLRVAPTFDHASSLGRELRDERRAALIENDRVVHYLLHGRGGIYRQATDEHGANPIKLVEFGVKHYRKYFFPALDRLNRMPVQRLIESLDGVPASRMSGMAKKFAAALLTASHSRLRGLLK